MSDDKIRIEFDRLEATTDKAWCISIDDDKYWIPKSKCTLYSGEQVVYMPEWLTEQKGLI